MIHVTNLGLARRASTLPATMQSPRSPESRHRVIVAAEAPKSPQSRHRAIAAVPAPHSPQSRHRVISAGQTPQPRSPQLRHCAIAAGPSPFVSQVANLQQSPRGLSALQSDSLSQCQRAQPTGACEAPSDIRHLRTVIQSELHAFQKTLVAEREAAVKQFRAVTEACFQAESERHQHLAKQHCDLEKTVQHLEVGLSNMDSRLSRVAVLHLSAQADHQMFRNTALDLVQSLEESYRTLQHKLRLANILPDDAVCRNLDGHSSKHRGGGQPATSSPSSLHASPPASEKGAFLATDPSLASTPAKSEFETSMRIEVLEAALASMQFHEQEQIHLLQERIQDFRKHTTLPLPSIPGEVLTEKVRRPWQDCMERGTILGA